MNGPIPHKKGRPPVNMVKYLTQFIDHRTRSPYFFGPSYSFFHLDWRIGPKGLPGKAHRPEEADLLIITAPMAHAQVPLLKSTYLSLMKPCQVLLMGGEAFEQGPHQSYNTISSIEEVIPVDVKIPGHPPSEQAVINGLKRLESMGH